MASTGDTGTLLSVFASLLVKHGDQAGLEVGMWKKEELRSEEVGDGNLNAVHKVWVSRDESQAVILKHSPPYIKILGPDYPLSVGRLRIEHKALSTFGKLAEGYVPKVYFYDEEANILCMEYLDGFSDLRKAIMQGSFHLDVADQLGRFLAAVHGGTHVRTVKQGGLDKLDQQFQNPGLMSLTAQFVFTRPFTADDETNKTPDIVRRHLPLVYNDPAILAAAAEMKALFLGKKECLVHGDLHTGSVMVKETSTKVIDAEFAYVGPGAFDVGTLIANYLMAYYCHMSMSDNHDTHRAFAQTMVDACHRTVNRYFDNLDIFMGDMQTAYQEAFMTEVAGFAGCEIIRRIIGAGQLKDFTATGVSAFAMEDAFEAGVRLLAAYKRIHSIDQLTVIALMLV